MRAGDGVFAQDFSRNFEALNRLSEERFHMWAFYPGMLFMSREKWWGDMGRRQTAHEGLDIGVFLDYRLKPVLIPDQAVVPVVFEGEVLAFGEDDFFGYTLYVKHADMRVDGRVLCTIYGHVTPHPDLYPGKLVQTSEIIALVSDFGTPKSGITRHLHLSVGWVRESSARDRLTWKMLNDSNIVKLIDPMVVFRGPYTLIGSNAPQSLS